MSKMYILNKSIRKTHGHTLVENAVAICLLGIIIAATILALVTARMYALVARHHYQAASLAREEVERILAGESSSPGTVTIDSATGLTGTLAVSNPTSDTLEVKVSWTDKYWVSVSKEETIVMFLP